ncbi:MAG: hypothetical protein ACOVNP_01200 [Flavobacterium sp.]
MRKLLFILSISLGFVMMSWAQTSNLVVFSEDLEPFFLVVNGIKQNTTAQTNVKVTDLKTSDNAVMVIFQDKALGTVKQNLYFTDMGVEVTAKITKTSKGYKLRYFDEVPLSEAEPASANQYTTSFQTEDEIPEIVPVAHDPVAVAPATTTTVTQPAAPAPKAAPTAAAVDFTYKWAVGKKYTFVASQIDNVSTSMMGMNMKEQFNSKTKFLMSITSVAANGNATGMLHVLDFSVTDSKGRVLATLANVPSGAIKSDFKVDTNGNFTFLKKISLVTTAQGNALVFANATDNSLSVGGQSESIKVAVYAEFDAKSGGLKTGYTIKEAQPVKQITLKVDEDTDIIDVLPYDYLTLLALPEGKVQQGDQLQANAGIYTIDVLAKSISNGVAQLNYKMSSDKNKNPFASSATMQSENSSLSAGMPNMNQMMSEMSIEDQQSVALTKQVMPNLTMDFDSFFDYNVGMFTRVQGIMTTNLNTMGVKMEVVSNLELKKL